MAARVLDCLLEPSATYHMKKDDYEPHEPFFQEALRMILGLPEGFMYEFHRAEGFYPIVCGTDAEAIAMVPFNPGTLSIFNCITGKTIWKQSDN